MTLRNFIFACGTAVPLLALLFGAAPATAESDKIFVVKAHPRANAAYAPPPVYSSHESNAVVSPRYCDGYGGGQWPYPCNWPR